MTTDPELVPVTNYDLFVANVRSALGKHHDADAGLVCSIALLTAEHDQLRQKAEAAESELAALRARVEGLQAFAQDVMECWPEGAPDGADLQEIATKHDLLREVVMPGPCGEDCGCTEFISPEDWPAVCYRKTSLLTGNPESDARIDRLLADPARPVTDDLVTTTERG